MAREEELECSVCFSLAVKRQDDGSYVCKVCHAVQDLQKTYEEVDPVSMPTSFSYSVRLSQKPEEDVGRMNHVVLSEAIQLILACQTVAAERKIGIDISDSVHHYLRKFHHLLQAPITKNTFSYAILILLSGIVHSGLPVTHIDIIRWIRDGEIPFMKPLEFLPESFVARLSSAEGKSLTPNLVNVNLLVTDHGRVYSRKIHPLPNPKLVIWRIASFLRLPERSFVAFVCRLAATKPFSTVSAVSEVFGQHRNSELVSIHRFMKFGYAVPLGLTLVALHIIYRLDGTNWIHPFFESLGYPSFETIVKESLVPAELEPAFPALSGRLPPLHADLQRMLEDENSTPVDIHTFVTPVRDGHGRESALVHNVTSLACLNPDARVVTSGLCREFGIKHRLVLQQFAILTDRRFGNRDTMRGKVGTA